MIVLDTNVVSELMRAHPDAAVVDCVDRQAAGEVWLTSMTAAELLAGVAQLPAGTRKQQLGSRVQHLLTDVFADRVLPFDQAAAVSYAAIVSARRAASTPIGVADATIAATCLAAGVTSFATRNTRDFTDIGLALANPWNTDRT